jgi:hypothetical protein
VDDALPLCKASLSIFAKCLKNLPTSLLDIASIMPALAKRRWVIWMCHGGLEEIGGAMNCRKFS